MVAHMSWNYLYLELGVLLDLLLMLVGKLPQINLKRVQQL